MNNVVTINRGKFLRNYADSQQTSGSQEPITFLGGVFLWMILPKLVYADYGGPISLTAFAVLALMGVILGLVIYRYFPPKTLSIVDPNILRSPDTVQPSQRKAA